MDTPFYKTGLSCFRDGDYSLIVVKHYSHDHIGIEFSIEKIIDRVDPETDLNVGDHIFFAYANLPMLKKFTEANNAK